jgi:hypothetical protein
VNSKELKGSEPFNSAFQKEIEHNQMAIGTLTQKLRPIRIAFLVNPMEKEKVQKAIHINSLLWGGMINPLIPCYTRLPKKWSTHKELKGTEGLKNVQTGQN